MILPGKYINYLFKINYFYNLWLILFLVFIDLVNFIS